jgi:hypothetical protein
METRNRKPETGNPKPRNLKHEIRTPHARRKAIRKPETGNLKPET